MLLVVAMFVIVSLSSEPEQTAVRVASHRHVLFIKSRTQVGSGHRDPLKDGFHHGRRKGMDDMREHFRQENLRVLESDIMAGRWSRALVICRSLQNRCRCRDRKDGDPCMCGNGYTPTLVDMMCAS